MATGKDAPLASRLRELRVRRGVSLSEVANAVGKSRGYLCSLENGRYENPTMELCSALAAFYGVEVGVIVGDTEAEPPVDLSEANMLRLFRLLTPKQRRMVGEMMQELRTERPHLSKPGVIRSERAAGSAVSRQMASRGAVTKR